MKLVTGSNQRYCNRMSTIHSVLKHGSFDMTYVGVGWQPPAIPGAVTTSITQEQNHGAPPETECIQHGSFLHVVGGLPEEVIIYCDGDLTQQRPIEDDELDYLNLAHDQVLVGWNGREGETLADEAKRLGPLNNLDEWNDVAGDLRLDEMNSYNVGCIAMTRQSWHYLSREYMSYWEPVCKSFSHAARQQWLISWIINRSFMTFIMPWSFHYHGHHGKKPGMTRQGMDVLVDGRVALFRHFT